MRAGSAFVARESKTTAQLRLLILTADARVLGLGGKLTVEYIAFAPATGYKKLVLGTNSILFTARAIYSERGFKLAKSKHYRAFGHDLVDETWELSL